MSDLIPAEQIQQLTGYKRPADQLRELLRQGFYRARRAKVTGHVVLETPHYHAVLSGAKQCQARPSVDIYALMTAKRRRAARPIDWDAKTALYRHFDKAGRLLYIGIAVNPASRESAHRCYSEWRSKIHSIELEWFPTRHEAVAAERAAIAAEHPKYNILHRREPQTC